jgi:choline transporter-like protein 2/4/5
VQYCLWYLQKVIEWLNRNAYIMIAIEGKSFCWSAWEAISLIFANILTVGAVNVVGDTLLFLGKLSVSLLAGFLAFLMLDSETYTTGANKVSSPLFIVIFVVVFAYVIAGLFMSVVEMAIDTVLLSFCKDVKLHGGKPKFAPPLLEEVLGKAEEEGKAKQAASADKAKAKAGALYSC